MARIAWGRLAAGAFVVACGCSPADGGFASDLRRPARARPWDAGAGGAPTAASPTAPADAGGASVPAPLGRDGGPGPAGAAEPSRDPGGRGERGDNGSAGGPRLTDGGASRSPRRALIYKGPTSCRGCETAVASLLARCAPTWTWTFVGPGGDRPITAALLAEASLYVQPGGDGAPTAAFTNPTVDMAAIKSWVRGGGRYLGFCLGGYYAGSWGFNILPGDAESYIESKGADIHTTADTMVRVLWRGVPRTIFFQEGASFTLASGASAEILARYAANDAIAAMVTRFGHGKVGVSGPHPEAVDWGVSDPDGDDTLQGCDLVDTLMAP